MGSNYKHFIEGKNIYLREVRFSDVNENYYKWLNDSDVNRYLETKYIPQSVENIKKYVEKMDGNPNEIFLAICLRKNNEHIGNIKLGSINWIHSFADISLLIGNKKYWGKGIATEAITLLTGFAFNTLNLNSIKVGCYSDNIGSKKAFLKAGYEEVGRLKKHRYYNGKYTDEVILEKYK